MAANGRVERIIQQKAGRGDGGLGNSHLGTGTIYMKQKN